jgi:hypothetical protein
MSTAIEKAEYTLTEDEWRQHDYVVFSSEAKAKEQKCRIEIDSTKRFFYDIRLAYKMCSICELLGPAVVLGKQRRIRLCQQCMNHVFATTEFSPEYIQQKMEKHVEKLKVFLDENQTIKKRAKLERKALKAQLKQMQKKKEEEKEENKNIC